MIVEQIQPLADIKEITLLTDLAPELWAKGDPDHLTSLFLNLLDNAMKYTPKAGVVRYYWIEMPRTWRTEQSEMNHDVEQGTRLRRLDPLMKAANVSAS